MSARPDDLKRAAAEEALTHVRSGMVLGLGTGSTVAFLLDALGRALERGQLHDIVGVATSVQTELRAAERGIPLAELDRSRRPDLTIDGADEVEPGLDLIKGRGGALLREKMVAQASDRVVIIADESKVVQRLGTVSALPVEVVEWGYDAHIGFLEGLGAVVETRISTDGTLSRSDNGNVFLDCWFEGGIDDPAALEAVLNGRAGIVDCGLFLGIADAAVIAAAEGVRTLTRSA